MFDRSAHVYDLIYGFKDYEQEARDLVTVVRERNPEASSLFDVACGTGEHLRLVRPAFAHVEGVDVEPGMLAVARGKLPDVVFTEADMRTFDLGQTFGAVTCLFSSVGYMADVGELDAAVARMAAHVAPGGVLVIDGWIRPDVWHPGNNVMAQSETDDETAVARVVRSRRDGNRTHLEMRYLVATHEGFDTIEETHVLTLFGDEEYRAGFAAAGLEADVIPGPMGPDRDRYVAVRRS